MDQNIERFKKGAKYVNIASILMVPGTNIIERFKKGAKYVNIASILMVPGTNIKILMVPGT